MTGQIEELLWDRAGHEDLPQFMGPDNDPGEPDPPDPPEPEGQTTPRYHLVDEDYVRAADMLTVEVAAIRAVAEIEAAGHGFLPDGRPVILYEAHIFGRLTNHRHSMQDSRGKALSARSWDRSLYGPSGAWQHDGRLALAAKLDWAAAHKACSWGYFQILGTNHQTVGFKTIHEMVEAANSNAGAHLDMLVKFVRDNKLDVHLRNRNWAAFARGYNGPGYAANGYDTKLAVAYTRWKTAKPMLRRGMSGDAVREVQQRLDVPVDGYFGPETEDAVKAFQTFNGLTADGIVGQRTWAALAR